MIPTFSFPSFTALLTDVLHSLVAGLNVSKEFPDREIAALVTSAWKADREEDVPTDVTPASNSFLWFAPINACYRHSIADETCSINKSVREYLEGWLRLFPANRVGILEFYDADWGSRFAHPGYEPMTQRLGDDMKYYLSAGIAGIYAWPGMGHSILGFRGQHELTINVFTQLAWNVALLHESFKGRPSPFAVRV